jgi:hypothetical protein
VLSLHEMFPHLFHNTVRAEKRVQDHKMTRNYMDIKTEISILFYKLTVLERKSSVEMGVVADQRANRDGRCTYESTRCHVRVIFVPPRQA